jgi:uncharacterized cupin superfamily protein
MAWRAERIEAIPNRTADGFWNEWAKEPDYGGRWHSIGEALGISGFGVNANEADAGRELIVPHTETAYGGQEELYVIVRGRARFRCDGEQVDLGPGEVLHVSPDVSREAEALEDGTLVLCIGGTPGEAYTAAG